MEIIAEMETLEDFINMEKPFFIEFTLTVYSCKKIL